MQDNTVINDELLEALEGMVAQARAGTLEQTSTLAMAAILW